MLGSTEGISLKAAATVFPKNNGLTIQLGIRRCIYLALVVLLLLSLLPQGSVTVRASGYQNKIDKTAISVSPQELPHLQRQAIVRSLHYRAQLRTFKTLQLTRTPLRHLVTISAAAHPRLPSTFGPQTLVDNWPLAINRLAQINPVLHC
jgi:hypothetical protein